MGTGTPSRRTGRGDSRRRIIAQIIREFGRREGHPPSLREIAEGAGLAVSTVSYHLSVLEQDGVLRRGAGRPRTIVQPADPAPGGPPGTRKSRCHSSGRSRRVSP
jgi:SOS-response transcriptional repressor LexA